MNTNRQIFLDELGAAAHLRSEGRVHNNQLATSFFHFVCQQLGEQHEACIVRGERKDATCTDPISIIAYRTIVLKYFKKVKRKNERKNEGTAYAVSKFPCRLKTTVPFGDYYGYADWFWERQKNSYVVQVEPERYKTRDRCIIDFREALHIEKIRNRFFEELGKIIGKQK